MRNHIHNVENLAPRNSEITGRLYVLPIQRMKKKGDHRPRNQYVTVSLMCKAWILAILLPFWLHKGTQKNLCVSYFPYLLSFEGPQR